MVFKTIGGSVFIQNVPAFLKELAAISSSCNTTVQAMDSDKIAGENHIGFAVEKALRAMENELNIARDTGVEIMRYASGKRQIEEAFSMGVREGEMNVVFVVLGEAEKVDIAIKDLANLIEEKPVVAYSEIKNKALFTQFSITEQEIAAAGKDRIPQLVLERIALVDILK
ncbi:KEOPS complex subunit Cgi121 [Methanolobus bombayensis]|uniref:KEOPS complex subunit Cgi121 n=1 Tax=Methanolobus bombayensis TaxID=38023 RepID=UPI001AE6801C|nr:KEOPS complex subunit Cgi121 [Methanolobus bombayensis]MBP1909258.1 KEOPS complex subunit Cgi121 [Methanolobus bombayensis]